MLNRAAYRSCDTCFWPADWSQFVPDAIIALATGIIVGVLLWHWQRTNDTRARRDAAESGWAVARPHAMAVGLELEQRETEYLVLYTAQLDGLIDLGTMYPIGQWADAAPKNDELRQLRDLLILARELQRLAAELDSYFEQQVVQRSFAKWGNTDFHERAASHYILELPPPDYLIAEFTEPAAQILGPGTVGGRMVEEFRVTLKQVVRGLESLRALYFAGRVE